MDTVTLVAALTLAGIFGLAGITKLRDLQGTRTAVRAFGGPVAIVPVVALVLPLVELAVAMSLLVPMARVMGTVGALGLLVLFSVVIAVNLARGKKPECHCFGQLHSAPTGWKTLARNALLGSIAAGLLVATRNEPGPSPWGWATARNATELGWIVGIVAAVTLITAIGASFLALTRAYGRVLIRLEATEKALQAAGIGSRATRLAGCRSSASTPGRPHRSSQCSSPNADPVTRDQLLAPGVPLLLVFTSPGCGPCHDLLPAVARWQRELRRPVDGRRCERPGSPRRSAGRRPSTAWRRCSSILISRSPRTTSPPAHRVRC